MLSTSRRRSARPLHLALLALATLVLVPVAARAQGVRLFRDGSGTYWDLSYGYASGSSIEVVNGSKAPLDYTTFWRGTSALRMRYTPRSGGDWLMGVANTGWAVVDGVGLDSLIFWAYSPTALPASELPYVFIEDVNNTRSPRYPMSPYNPNGLPAGVWTRLVMPLAPIQAGPGSANMAKLNKTFFAQNPASTMNVQRTVYLDELRWVYEDPTPPVAPPVTDAMAFERHVDLLWDLPVPADVESYRVERRVNGTWTPWVWAAAERGGVSLWLGAPAMSCSLRVITEDWSLRESAPSAEFTLSTVPLDDAAFLDMIERATFRYFWQGAHPTSGLIRERTSSGDICAAGGTGFGLMAIPVGVERGYVTRAQGVARVLQMLTFLSNAESYWGAFPHWINGVTGLNDHFLGPTDDTMDIVETAYLAEGLLTVRRYFDGAGTDEAQIRALATALWEGMDWTAFRGAGEDALRWHRSPTSGLSSAYVIGWNECMITYLLGVASPTHPLPPVCYHSGWARNGAIELNQSYYGYPLSVGYAYGGPMFFAHYSFVGFDPRAKRDAYANYNTHNRNHALVQVAYAAANPGGYTGYNADCWGLTASDDPYGYQAHAAYSGDNGTITPSAALGSIVYVPREALRAAHTFYDTYGSSLWSFYGFLDAFHPGLGWTASDHIAIDQGPILLMIENYRSGLLWDRFMANPEIAPMLATLGFEPDSDAVTGVTPTVPTALRLAALPNPSSGAMSFALELPVAGAAELEVFDLSGRRVAVRREDGLGAGRHVLAWDGRGPGGTPVAPGVYLARVRSGDRAVSTRVVRMR
jgi:exo beta-1,2-glucooligosaccharide sophorohydrolase (non-reducing end)